MFKTRTDEYSEMLSMACCLPQFHKETWTYFLAELLIFPGQIFASLPLQFVNIKMNG